MLREALGPSVPRELIARGVDCLVFRVGGQVVKEYNPHITFEQVLGYEAVTKRLADFLDDKGYSTKGLIADTPFDMRFTVVPVTFSTFNREKGTSSSVAPYIPGPRLADFLKDRPISTNGEIRELGNPEERSFFESLLRSTNIDGKGFNRQREAERLAKFSRQMNVKLGIRGIDVSPADVKMRLSAGGDELIYVITDLCPSITTLQLNKRRV